MAGLLSRILTGLMRLFFRLLYHEFAWSYDFVAWAVSLGRWRDWVLSTLPYLSGPRVLELGHGPGHLQSPLLARGVSAVGLDESSPMGRLAACNIRKQGQMPSLVNGYAQTAPFCSSSFSQVAATFPSEYIFHPETAAEIYRLLEPGGTAVILPIAWITGSSLPEKLAALLFRITAQSPGEVDVLLMDRVTLPFQQVGFQVETITLERTGSRLLLILARKPGGL